MWTRWCLPPQARGTSQNRKMATIAAQLYAMGLSPKDTQNDIALKPMKNWTEKRKFQTKILTSDLCEDRPDGPELFAVAQHAGQATPPTCNLMIPIAIVSAVIPGGNPDGTPKS